MFVYKVIFNKLSNAAPVSAIVGTRISPGVINEGDALPAITYEVIDSVPQDTKDGASTLDVVRVDIDFWGEVLDTLKDLANKSRTVLERFTGTAAGVTISGTRFIGERSDDFQEISQKGVFHIIHTYEFRENL